ncbi:MAG: dTMP kinase [Spirochaetes bacterium]|nr:MAG: dTMP kinase [Spirochaetota bacterium]
MRKDFAVIKGFIVFEGLDGAGTTTQAALLREKFKTEGIKCSSECEPTANYIGKVIRRVLGGDVDAAPGTLAKLFAADRNEHLYNREEGIVTRCRRGETVISDRYLFSSLAYQSLRYGFENVLKLNMDYPVPEHLFYLDVPEEICQNRLEERDELEIFEKKSIQRDIAENYRRAIELYSESEMKIHILDGTLPPEELGKIVWSKIT